MGSPLSMSSRSSLFLRGLLVTLAVLLAWRILGGVTPTKKLLANRFVAGKRDGRLGEAGSPGRGHGASRRTKPAVEYTDDRRLRAKRDMTPLSQRLRRKKRALDSLPAAPRPIPVTAVLPSTRSLSKSTIASYDEFFNSLTAISEQLVADALTPSLEMRLVGVPGTGISSAKEATALQAYLDCVSSNGEWVYDSTGTSLARTGSSLTVHKQEGRYAACDKRFYKGRDGKAGSLDGDAHADWDVRESLKWRWQVAKECAALAPASLAQSARARAERALLPSRYRFCELLEGKHVLLLGDTTQWSLHDLLIDWTTLKPQTCYGDRYCMAHALCSDILTAGRTGSEHSRARTREDVDRWELDQRVYHRLPPPPKTVPRADKRQVGGAEPGPVGDGDESGAEEPPSSGEKMIAVSRADCADTPLEKRASTEQKPDRLVSTTLLRYRRADGLRFARPQVVPDYRPESTGVRELNQQWLADSRRSDLVILTKPPLPLPRAGHNGTFDAWLREYVHSADDDDGAPPVEAKALRVLEAAKWATEQFWVPELLETLRAVRAPPSPPDQLVVYRGGWRQHPDCAASTLRDGLDAASSPSTSPGDGPPPHVSHPTLASLLMRRRAQSLSAGAAAAAAPAADDLELVPLHIAYHNAQLLFQNHLARTVILPAFGVPFLDLGTPLSVWRSGMVGSSAAAPFLRAPDPRQQQQQAVLDPVAQPGQGLRSPTSGDCTRYCFPSPGLAVERFFLGAIATVFEAGWAGTVEREEEWIGPGFRHLQTRHASPS
ncbi:hypothetical protein JCM3774_003258 [Rhodotorula dairenensis]